MPGTDRRNPGDRSQAPRSVASTSPTISKIKTSSRSRARAAIGRAVNALFEPLEERRRQMGQSIHTNYFHILLFFLSARKTIMHRKRADVRERVAFIPPPGTGRVFPLLLIKSCGARSQESIFPPVIHNLSPLFHKGLVSP